MLIGLTGGMACGKSFVATTFASLGAHIIEADDLGRATMAPGGTAYAPIVKEFGTGILAPDGTIDRQALARLVFSNPAELAKLNGLIHPAVRAMARAKADRIEALDPHAVVIYVAAILIESGGHQECEKIVVVSCTAEQQMERALAREGATEASVRSRLAHQIPLEEKLRRADYVIDTSGAKEDTVRQTKLVYEALLRLAL